MTGPAVSAGAAHVAGQLRQQARSCSAMGSPLYGSLLRSAAADVEAGGPAWSVLAGHVLPGRGDAVALRFMAAVHRLVLAGEAPDLARHYPSAGGDADAPAAWQAFRVLLAERHAEIRGLLALPCQTNEVGRAAALVGGFLQVAADTGLPLRVLEVGASAGLNLRWDQYHYGGGGAEWGPRDSRVDLTGHWVDPPPHTDLTPEVVERRGCDRRPVDPTTSEGRLALAASVWADQRDRLARLQGALTIAADVPVVVDQASAEEWIAQRLATPVEGVATVVFHSVVEEYLPERLRRRFHQTIEDAGAAADADAPLAWLRLEPVSALRSHGVTLTSWPNGGERLLATSGAHGTDVRWGGR